jgi:hypothetical protein
MESQMSLRISNSISLLTFENYTEGGCLGQARPPGTGGAPDVTPMEYWMRQMAEVSQAFCINLSIFNHGNRNIPTTNITLWCMQKLRSMAAIFYKKWRGNGKLNFELVQSAGCLNQGHNKMCKHRLNMYKSCRATLTTHSPWVTHSLTIRKRCLRASLWETTIPCWPQFHCQNSNKRDILIWVTSTFSPK